MSLPARLASAISLALTVTFAVLGTTGAKALPQDPQIRVSDAPAGDIAGLPGAIAASSAAPTYTSQIVVQPLPDATSPATDGELAAMSATSLSELVDVVPVPSNLTSEIECLAGAVYFEAKSESLDGQLAVGRVIVARTASGRFPDSYCGVVYQHAQFSFLHGGAMPVINRTSHTWLQAVKIALIAHHGAWKSPAEGALFFHAARVGPVAGKTRIAQIDNHVFYR